VLQFATRAIVHVVLAQQMHTALLVMLGTL
jgi:hypothetical protein